jgi:hypothetical protein
MPATAPGYVQSSGVASPPDDAPRLQLLPPEHQAAVGAVPVTVSTRRRVKIPAQIQLGQLRHPLVRLRAPLRLRTRRHGDIITVAYPELDLWGEGPHLTAALEDFEQTLLELYFGLHDAREDLGPGLVPVWERLQQLVDERS